MLLLPAFTGSPQPNKVYNCDALTLLRAMPAGSVDLLVTDPPYLMTKRGKSNRPNWMHDGMGENLFDGTLPNVTDWMIEVYRVLKDGTHFYTFCSMNDITDYLVTAQAVGFKLHNIINMLKDTHTPNQWYMKYCEPILFFRKGAAKPINDPGSRDYFSVTMPQLKNGKKHITEKPVSILMHLISNSSQTGELVVDPFGGSGSTAVAAKRLGRNYITCDTNYECCELMERQLVAPYSMSFMSQLDLTA